MMTAQTLARWSAMVFARMGRHDGARPLTGTWYQTWCETPSTDATARPVRTQVLASLPVGARVNAVDPPLNLWST